MLHHCPTSHEVKPGGCFFPHQQESHLRSRMTFRSTSVMLYSGLRLQSVPVSSVKSVLPVSIHLEGKGFLTSCPYCRLPLTSALSVTLHALSTQASKIFPESQADGVHPSRVGTLLLSCPCGTTPSKKQSHCGDEQPTFVCTQKPIAELSKGVTN